MIDNKGKSVPLNKPADSMNKPRSTRNFFLSDDIIDSTKLDPNRSYRLVAKHNLRRRESMGWEVVTNYEAAGQKAIDGAVTHDLILMSTTKENAAEYKEHLAAQTKARTERSSSIKRTAANQHDDITGMESV